MTPEIPSFLRLHVDEPLPPRGPEMPDVSRLELAFEMCTGWCFELQSDSPPSSKPAKPPADQRLGSWRLSAASGSSRRAGDPAAVRALAESISDLWTELARTRRALWEREAELAAGVPVVVKAAGDAHIAEKHIAEKLESALQGGAQAIGCDAAALYLLDEATSALKLRSQWGLPASRFTDPARPLAGQVADLEALLGQAVVLEDAATLPSWKIPEPYLAGVCVPVSTGATLLGTLWGFNDNPRAFNDHQTNVWEITAGRIAAELERQVLLAEAQRSTQQRRASDQFVPRLIPEPRCDQLLDGWEVAGWAQGEQAFYDAFLDAEDRLLFVAGANELPGFDAALAIQALRATLRGLATRRMSFPEILRSLHRALAATSASDPGWRLSLGRLNPRTGRVQLVVAGPAQASAFRQQAWQAVGPATPPLGSELEWSPVMSQFGLRRGDLLLATDALRYDALANDKGAPSSGPANPWLNRSPAEIVSQFRASTEPRSKSSSAGIVLRRAPS